MDRKSKRNYPVALLLGLLTAANILFHAEALGLGADLEETVRGGVVHPPLLLIAVIGGRICPTFTANWMKRQGLAPLPIPFNRFDALTILVLVIAIVSALATDYGIAASYLLAGAGVASFAYFGGAVSRPSEIPSSLFYTWDTAGSALDTFCWGFPA